jgi:16S rRNA (adenine1518-N6/adenine1519-N6)-dimethyltransferase
VVSRDRRQRYGQHFLTDARVADTIVRHFAPARGDIVLEIGPGKGILTRRLAGRVGTLVAVEIDSLLAGGLEKSLGGVPGVHIVCDDILRWDPAELLADDGTGGKEIRVISNLPYSVAAPILVRLFGFKTRLCDALLMVQREMADRAAAVPGSRLFGPMAVLFEYHTASVSRLMEVSRKSFSPPPKVDSSLLSIRFSKTPPVDVKDEAFFFRVVRAAFQHRRKVILNSLQASGLFPMPKPTLASLLRSAGLNPEARPESIDIGQFAALSDALLAASGPAPGESA